MLPMLPDQLPINEIFQTIQGEGSKTGRPSLFVRFQFCDVGCSWCDTKHTWKLPEKHRVSAEVVLGKTETPDTTYANFTTIELDKLIEDRCRDMGSPHVVITGGEPCFYDLGKLTDMIACYSSVQIETSGTYEIKCADEVFVTVSPKVGMAGGRNLERQAIHRANEIKFPVGKQSDIETLITVIEHFNIEVPVYLQPLSTSIKATRLCEASAAKYGWNVSYQVHKMAGIR